MSRVIDDFLNQSEAIRRLMEPTSAVASVLEAAQRQKEMYDAAFGGSAVREALERDRELKRSLIAPSSSFQRLEEMYDAALGGSAVREALERDRELKRSLIAPLSSFQRQEEMFDAAFGGSAVREALERDRELKRSLIAPLLSLSFQQSEIVKAVEQLQRPWMDLGSHVTALAKSHLDTKRAIEKMLPRNIFPEFVDEWEHARQALAKPEWMKFAEELASRSSGVGALELLDDLADFAYENRSEPTEVVPEKDEGRWRRLTVWEWMVILSFLIAIAQAVRSEYIASESDRKSAESEKRFHGAITTAQTLLLEEIRREFARRSNQRWAVLERPVWMTFLPESGSKRIVRLRPGEVLVEIDHQTKWIQVEVTIDGRVLSGWILKKYAERRPGPQEVADDDN